MMKVKPTWAGYNNEGNDYKGHMHPLKGGGFFRQPDGLEGVFCVAPVNEEDYCTDPPSKVRKAHKQCDWCHRWLPKEDIKVLQYTLTDHLGEEHVVDEMFRCVDQEECEYLTNVVQDEMPTTPPNDQDVPF